MTTSERRPFVVCLRPREDFVAVDALPPAELEVTFIPRDDGTLGEVDERAEVIVLASVGPRVPLTAFEVFPHLRMIHFTGVGIDRVDAAALRERGIEVRGSPALNAEDVAEYALAAAVFLLRGLLPSHLTIQSGEYSAARVPFAQNPPRALRGLRWGIIGFGVIGRSVGRMADAHGCEVTYYDVAESSVPFPAARRALDDVVRDSDIVSVHLPFTPQTAGLLSAERVALLRPSAVLINAARGGIVDEDAVRARLKEGTLHGAAFDVFAGEPPSPGAGILGAGSQDNVLLSPHIAGVTKQAWHDLFTHTWSAIAAGLSTGVTLGD